MSRSVVFLIEIRSGASKGLKLLIWIDELPSSAGGAGTGGVPEARSLADADSVRLGAGRSSGESWKSHVIWRRSQLLHRGPVSLH